MAAFEDVGGSGLPVFRKFCPKCGSAIVSEVVATPELEWLNQGTLDDPWLRTLVAEHGEEWSLGDFLLEELYSFVGEGWEQEDDITLLTLRRSATRS